MEKLAKGHGAGNTRRKKDAPRERNVTESKNVPGRSSSGRSCCLWTRVRALSSWGRTSLGIWGPGQLERDALAGEEETSSRRKRIELREEQCNFWQKRDGDGMEGQPANGQAEARPPRALKGISPGRSAWSPDEWNQAVTGHEQIS